MSTNSLFIRLMVAVTVAMAAVACSTADREKELVEEAMRTWAPSCTEALTASPLYYQAHAEEAWAW